MNVLRRTLYSFPVAFVLTAAAIKYYPETSFTAYSTKLIGLGFIATLALGSIAFYREDDLTMHDKNVLMNAFLVAILVPSLYTAGAFLHESQTSWSGGEIHYHADYEVIVNTSGNLHTLDLVDPTNYCSSATTQSTLMCKLNDRTGITKYHEHNDNRIHLEGIFKEREDATLAAYFETFHGELSNTRMVYPTNNRTVEVTENADKNLKIIVNRGTGGSRHWCIVGDQASKENTCVNPYTGELATSPSEYIISPHKKGPSLDDIFIIYDSSTSEQALEDLQEDGKYQSIGLSKEGEGF
ncbi:hypothetical protein GKQ38_04295 [Candidatus Nanohaloarchaea archaeon]|nr:hypothetical protein GKQ38_04295 [Candidatus Nanohaloarchaea archaeon]